jgi:hypothetical protein
MVLLSVVSIAIQAMPSTKVAMIATTSEFVRARRTVATAVTSDMASTSRSCPSRARTRGSRTAPRMAPAPTLPSIKP